MKILKKHVFEGEGDDQPTVFLIVKEDELNDEWFRQFTFSGSLFMIAALCFAFFITYVALVTGWIDGDKKDPIPFWMAIFVSIPFIFLTARCINYGVDKVAKNLVKYYKRYKKNTPANPRM